MAENDPTLAPDISVQETPGLAPNLLDTNDLAPNLLESAEELETAESDALWSEMTDDAEADDLPVQPGPKAAPAPVTVDIGMDTASGCETPGSRSPGD